jgi:DNA polymerase
LQLAVENLFKVKISKEVRDKMKTQSASSEEMRDYAADDSFWCAKIWTHYGHKWPQQEREISSMVRHHGYRGIAIPVEKIKENIAKLEGVKNEIRSQLPWGHKGVVSSLKLFSMACAFKGISAPLSLSQDSDSARHWESQYGEKYPWIQLIRKFTKANQVQSSLQLMLHRCREDGTVPFSLGYCKATHTKRFQHQEGLRIQNLDRDPVEGIHLRHMLVPRPGHVFIIADLSQIEPRVLALRAGDQPFLEACRKGQSPYEVHARTTMGYTDPRPLKEADPQTYALAKARLLALGYQTGPEQFVEMAYTMARLEIQLDEPTVLVDGLNLPMSEFQRIIRDQGHPNFKQWISSYRDGTLPILPSAKNAVYDFRESATYTTKLWKRRMNEVCACEGSHYTLPLENGSSLRYFDVEVKRSQKTSRSGRTYTSREVKAWVIRNSRNPKDQKYLYEGKIVENEVQWIAREVFVYLFHKVCQIPDVNGVFSVHDEGIWEVPEHLAETRLDDILRTLHQAPPWAPDLPVAAEGEISLHYKK